MTHFKGKTKLQLQCAQIEERCYLEILEACVKAIQVCDSPNYISSTSAHHAVHTYERPRVCFHNLANEGSQLFSSSTKKKAF